jgi:hypothetical protein
VSAETEGAPTLIPLVVCAKNEATMLGACLDSLAAAAAFAETRLPLTFARLVVLDDTYDKSTPIAVSRGFTVVRARGGKIEAQRMGARQPAPFRIFSDADIVVAPDTLHALCALMLAQPALQVATPPKQPVPPRASTRLARAIFDYNRHEGYARRHTWFSGKLFAIRDWQVPTPAQLVPRIAAAPRDRFLDLARGLVADDVYLSRSIVARHGPAAIARAPGGMVWFRAPETWRGMYDYFRRMQREIARVDALFPETRPIHRRWGRRRTDLARLRAAPLGQKVSHLYFRGAVALCRLRYVWDRFYHRHLSSRAAPEWTPIAETKLPVFDPPG